MKAYTVFLCAVAAALVLTGCRVMEPAPSVTSSAAPSAVPGTSAAKGTAETDSAGLLQRIWSLYKPEERFAVFGGNPENAVMDGPGDLDLSLAGDVLTVRYLLPEELLDAVEEGASMVHMMNGNIFTAAVVRLSEGVQPEELAKAWRRAIQDNHWLDGRPEQLLLMDLDGSHILMAYGVQETMELLRSRAEELFGSDRILFNETILG